MDQFLTTYRKDYLWPYVRTYPLREGPTYATVLPPRGGEQQRVPCTCGGGPGGEIIKNDSSSYDNRDSFEWSRLGPMGPLLDPKLYPAKVGSSPETPEMRINQPNTYLKKLQEKYPYLYNVLQSAPPDDMIKRINVDRLRTTYQIDFGHIDESPAGDYQNLLKEAGVDPGLSHCPPPTQIPGLDSRPKAKPIQRTEGNFCKNRLSSKKEDTKTAIPLWKSEYSDEISKTGYSIIKDRLHQHGLIFKGKNSNVLKNSCSF